MSKPRIRIDRNGWIKWNGTFPFDPKCRVTTRWADGRQWDYVTIGETISQVAPITLTHFKLAGEVA